MTDAGMVPNCPAQVRDADLRDAFAAGEGAERARNVAFIQAYAARLRAANPEAAAIVTALAQSINTGLAVDDPQSATADAVAADPEQGVSL